MNDSERIKFLEETIQELIFIIDKRLIHSQLKDLLSSVNFTYKKDLNWPSKTYKESLRF